MIADALAKAKLVTISGDSAEGGAAQSATSNMTSVIQTVLAAQLVSNAGLDQAGETRETAEDGRDNGRRVSAPAVTPGQTTTAARTGFRYARTKLCPRIGGVNRRAPRNSGVVQLSSKAYFSRKPT